jgi:hypothetical protein
MLQQALASRRVAIDRSRLTESDSAARPETRAVTAAARLPRVVLSWPYRETRAVVEPQPVPQVRGRSVREAALALHRCGFRVTLRGLGRVSRTVPPAGENAQPGTTVVVWAE